MKSHNGPIYYIEDDIRFTEDPLKIPKIKPKVLSTSPRPDHFNLLLINLPKLIMTKSDTINTKIPKPISE